MSSLLETTKATLTSKPKSISEITDQVLKAYQFDNHASRYSIETIISSKIKRLIMSKQCSWKNVKGKNYYSVV